MKPYPPFAIARKFFLLLVLVFNCHYDNAIWKFSLSF